MVAFLLTACAYEIQPRIVQGLTAMRGQFPFFAFLRIRYPSRLSSCGGALISNQWILTGAHCLKFALSVQVNLGSSGVRDIFGRKVINVMPMHYLPYVHPTFHPQHLLK